MTPRKPQLHVTLEDLLEGPDKAAEVPLERIPGMIAQLAAVQTALAARIARAPPPLASTEERLLGVEEAARKLGIPRSFLYKNHRRFPFTVKLGAGHLRFSLKGIERFIHDRQGPRAQGAGGLVATWQMGSS